MAAEEQDWILCMLFAVLGLAVGSFFSSACPAFFTFFAPSQKDVAVSGRKASSASCPSRILELQLSRETGSWEGHSQTFSDTYETQRSAAKYFLDNIEKPDQKKSTLEPGENMSQHQRIMSQPVSEITKLDQGRNDLDASESHSDVIWRPSDQTSLSSDRGGHSVQCSELVMQSLTPSKEFAPPNGDLKPDPFDPSKRQGYLSWDDYFMALAFLSALRSKDPNRQVGACLVSQDKVILGIGYNGFPRGCSDDELPWAKMSKNGDPLQTKYPYVCHAEVNAILNKNHASASGQRLYVTMFPCNECAKIIIQAGVIEVVYFDGKSSSTDCSYVASLKLLSMAGVKVWQHQPVHQKVVLDFK